MNTSFDPFGQMDRLADQLLGGRSSRFVPVDLYRDGERYVLSADLPGVDPGSIDVDLDGNLLTIRAQRTGDGRDDVKWIVRERTSGAYFRQFTLGDGLDTEAISATYDNGVLSLVIPVSEKAKPRKIAIATADERTSISA